MINKRTAEEIAIQDSVASCYNDVRYVKPYSENYQKIWVQDMTGLVTRSGIILDNGCGVGYLANFLPPDSLVGIDISEGMLKQARGKILDIVRGNSQNLPFCARSFDVIICRSLLHHLEDPERGLQEMNRVLKPKGEVIFSEPIGSVLSRIPRRLTRNTGHFSEVHKDFERDELISMIEREFTIEYVRHFGYIAYPVLGFPDIVDPLKKIPFQETIATVLIAIDTLAGAVPWFKKQSWGIIIKARKRDQV